MTYLVCSDCGHPHSHAVTLPPGGGKPEFCDQCPYCVAEKKSRSAAQK